jgi:hypothetical protein
MAYSTGASLDQSTSARILPTVTLALWRLRQTWGLLLVTGIGIIAAVMLVCSAWLYSQVAMTAGLRGALAQHNTTMLISTNAQSISSSITNSVTQQLNAEFQKNLGPYLNGPAQLSIMTPRFSLLAGNSVQNGSSLSPAIQLIGTEISLAAAHLRMIQGRLPQMQSRDMEIALRPETAVTLHVTVGSIIPAAIPFIDVSQKTTLRTLLLHVVGIFTFTTATDQFWHSNDLTPTTAADGSTVYEGLASNETILSLLTQMSDQATQKRQVFTTDNSADLLWYYNLNNSHISISQLDDLINGANTVQIDTANSTYLDQSPYIQLVQTSLPIDILEQYNSRISVVQLPVTGLVLLVLGLVLFFVSMMAELLIDRQSEAISLLRSRGASPRQIFAVYVTQSLGLGLVALVAGPLLAILLVRFLAEHILSAGDQTALNLVSGNMLQVALGLRWFALLTMTVTILAMIIATFGAMGLDVLAMRREAARSTRRPLWQRLNLDIVAAIIALIGFGFSVYVSHSGVLDAQLNLLLLSPLTLLESMCLLIAGMLLLLRLFPLLLRLGARLAQRGRGAAPMLALAQMARAPRQALRMTLLLALATAFAIFTLIFTASQTQRISDVAAFQTGADFSGSMQKNILLPNPSLVGQAARPFRLIPGVTSASLGYSKSVIAGGRVLQINVDFRAVDADTFAQSAIWPGDDSSQSLNSLMQQLVTQRPVAIARKIVPAIVDASAWNMLHLAPGAPFTLSFSPDGTSDLMKFNVVAEVQHIPTSGDGTTPIVVTDYQTYATIYGTTIAASLPNAVPLNTVWMLTRNDAVALTSVRTTLSHGPANMSLDPLYDRRAIIAELSDEPLYLTLSGVLILGATTALFLALLGTLLASWLSARSRLTSFAVLRALGAIPQQIASVLTWEQLIIYTTAIVLGIVFGLIFSLVVIPALAFTSVPPAGIIGDISSQAFFALQNTPPIEIVFPRSLWIALGLLIAICVIALGMMVGIVSRPSISQTLRLNED